MKIELDRSRLSSVDSKVVVLGILKGEDPAFVFNQIDAKLNEKFVDQAVQHLKDEKFKGKEGEIHVIPTFGNTKSSRLLIVGMGDECTPDSNRKLAAAVARRLRNNPQSVTVCLRTEKMKKTRKTAKKSRKTPSPAATRYSEIEHLKALVEGWGLGEYDFNKYKTKKAGSQENGAGDRSNSELRVTGLSLSRKDFNKASREAIAIADSTNLARVLVAEPSAFMTPTRLAAEARRIAKDTGLSCTTFNLNQIKKMNMGSFLGVARGADEPPRFIVLRYKPTRAKKTVAIVGKGITFDSGGLSLKTPTGMERMKYDMSGAAAVLGTMRVIGLLKPDVSVIGIVAATENMPSGKALHPGDVLTAMNGKTIEVNNTDAEGRLVLADALNYAIEQKVDEIIDLATLTGAIVQALGRVAAGVMGTGDELIAGLIEAGAQEGEKLWRMPLYEEYKQALKSDIADLKNAGSRGQAGSCCAAMFLKEFVDDSTPWAHIDIAGVAWSDKVSGEINKGGTAFGVRTLSRYLLSQ